MVERTTTKIAERRGCRSLRRALLVGACVTGVVPASAGVAVPPALAASWFDPALAPLAAGALALAAFGTSLLRRRGRPDRIEELRIGGDDIASDDRTVLPSAAVRAALDNMSEGLVLYDAEERLVMCNRRYAEIYRLPPELARAGTPFSTLLDHWTAIGLLDGADNRRRRVAASVADGPCRIELSLADGRIIELNERSFPEGGWIATHEDITERRRAEEKAHRLARRDTLTGLLNRLTFEEELAMRLAPLAAGRSGPDAPRQAVILVDLDRFKKVNDLFGHAIGDALLTSVAGRARAAAGRDGRVARLGGDEFAILLPAADMARIVEFAAELKAGLTRPHRFGHVAAEVGASIGIACAPEHGCSPSDLLARADRALRAAKSAGGDRIEVYSHALDTREAERRALVRDLAGALGRGELELAYQPIVDAESGVTHGAEALLRWTHPSLGRISPEHAIAIAEESGLIHPLGEWILETALAAAARWPAEISISVNLSASQFRSEEIVAIVGRALSSSGVAPHRLELEVTETVLCAPETVATMEALRACGIRLALDDFGTGYASLSYLMRFPFDRIKIDRSFVSGADTRPQCRAIIEAVGGLARSLNLQVVAEGVETESERALVRAAGCRYAQGWLFGRPTNAADFAAHLATVAADRTTALPTPTIPRTRDLTAPASP
ncbi:MAG: EAL domain-containing protein [Siculibacillus sp.]|nr:EAL domain-containing protein [Siculibacillus sp.]